MTTDEFNLDPSDLHGHVRALETDIGIAPGFLEGLIKEEDDWSFVIKLQALAEAAVTHLLTNTLGHEAIREVIARMPMGDGRRDGKLAMAKKLDVLASDIIDFFVTIGQIRNRFAHRVSDIGLRIEDYVNARPENERDHVWRSLAYFADADTFEGPDGQRIDTLMFAREHPLQATWWSAMNAIAVIYVSQQIRAHEQRREALLQHERLMTATLGALLQSLRPRGDDRKIGDAAP